MSLLDPDQSCFRHGKNRAATVVLCNNGHHQGIRDPYILAAVNSELRVDPGKQICPRIRPAYRLGDGNAAVYHIAPYPTLR